MNNMLIIWRIIFQYIKHLCIWKIPWVLNVFHGTKSETYNHVNAIKHNTPQQNLFNFFIFLFLLFC